MCRQAHIYMKNKKKIILLISSMLLSTVTLGMVGIHSFSFQASLASELPSSLDCNYYFNPVNGYKSIFEMNDDLFSNRSTDYEKTWGTVTGTYTSGNKNCAYIESTNKNGDSAALCLYSIPTQVEVGNVVTVSGGTFKNYSNMPEIEAPTTVHVDYLSNPYPVETFETDYSFWDTSSMTSAYKEALYRKGPMQVSVSQMVFGGSVTNDYTYLKFDESDTLKVQCWYKGSTNQTSIRSKFMDLYNGSSPVNVKGYVTYYNKTSLQILVRDPNDISAATTKLESLTVAPIGNIYVNDYESPLSFDATVHYVDGSSKTVTSGVELVEFSTQVPGKTTATLSYTEDNETVYGSCEVTILDLETSITVSDVVDRYYPNEPFIYPTVTAHLYDSEIDVSSQSVFVNDDTSYTGSYTCEVAYENAKGDVLETSYTFTVKTVSSLSINSFYPTFEIGEEMCSFQAIARFSDWVNVDVTNRESLIITGFDTSTPGNKVVTFTYGGRSFNVDYTVNGDIEIDRIDLEGNYKIYYSVGEAFDSPLVYAYYTDGTYADVTSQASFSGFDSSTTGVKEITVTYGEYVINYDVTITESSHLYEYDVSITIDKSYDTGSYGASGDFEYYRAVKQSGYICKLIPLVQQSGCEPTLGGALYNVNPIKDIDRLTLTYSTSGSGSRNPKFTYGENSYDDGYKNIPLSSYTKQTTFDLSSNDINYLKFDSGDYTLYIEALTIYYSGDNTPNGSSFVNGVTGNNEYRISPTVYSGDLIDGVSYIDVPTSFDVNTLTVTSTKRYTYYSYEYVSENPEYKSEATITDPVDVCNYFQAFGCAPANYGTNNTVYPLRDGKTLPSKSEVNSLFGSDARTISQYSSKTGYATSVPFYGTYPTYYELDINTNGQYSTSSRQVGRIVAWATGFKGNDYGNGSQVVCTYTDDHYATFKEYNNYGGFLSRFNASFKIAGYVRGNPTTLSY